MGREAQTSTRGTDVEAACLGAAIEAVTGLLTTMRPLRRERDRLMNRHAAGSADADDQRRYRMLRLRLLVLESANRGVRQPRRAAEVMADRRRLEFVALVGRRDQFPEPQPS